MNVSEEDNRREEGEVKLIVVTGVVDALGLMIN